MTVIDEKGDEAYEIYCPNVLRQYVEFLPVQGAHSIPRNLTQPMRYDKAVPGMAGGSWEQGGCILHARPAEAGNRSPGRRGTHLCPATTNHEPKLPDRGLLSQVHEPKTSVEVGQLWDGIGTERIVTVGTRVGSFHAATRSHQQWAC